MNCEFVRDACWYGFGKCDSHFSRFHYGKSINLNISTFSYVQVNDLISLESLKYLTLSLFNLAESEQASFRRNYKAEKAVFIKVVHLLQV